MDNHYKHSIQEYMIPHNSLIGAWTIDESVCDELIKYHKNSQNKIRGLQCEDNRSFVDKNIKDSLDVCIKPQDLDKIDASNKYCEYLFRCLKRYLQKYPYADYVPKFGIGESLNIQHYEPGGGYKAWHFENGNKTLLKRYLVYMTYLNDVPDGGTEFLYQNIKLPAIKGLTVIWPAYWTHTHKGQITKKHEKYIATGWFQFE